jgi:hypothetical protein
LVTKDDRLQGVDGFGEVEENLLDEVGGHVKEDNVQNWELYP